MAVTLSTDEIAARGRAMYVERVAPAISPSDAGKYVSIEVESGDYFVDADAMTAIRKSRQAHPDGVFHLAKIGSPTVGRVGAGMRVPKA